MKKSWKKITKNSFWFNIIAIFFLFITLTTCYTLYAISLLSGIENFLRSCGALGILTVWLMIGAFAYNILIKNKKTNYIIFMIAVIIYGSGITLISYTVDSTFGRLSQVSSNYVNYSSSIIALNATKGTIKSLGSGKIGMIKDPTSIDGYQIPQEIIKNNHLKNSLVKYDSFIALIDALRKKEVTYVFLPTNYVVMFGGMSEYTTLNAETKIIYSHHQKVKKAKTSITTNRIDKPFTILLMGVDSEKEGIANSSFNGDSLMLITFNPDTLNSTILSIPRDTYVPIACFANNRENKITHAAWYGQDCMIETIQNFTGIDINYYVKINFKGVVQLVDTLGGVEINVPYNFCEQNSNREWGKNTIYVRKGLRTLTGEQTLALARNRHPNADICGASWANYNSNDFVRGQNQQLIVKSLMNKMREIRSLAVLNKLLSTLSNNVGTNMTTNEILSFYNVAKDILSKGKEIPVEEVFSMQRLYLSGYDRTIYDYSMINRQGTRLPLYNFIPYIGSLADVITAMKVNLGLLDEQAVKTFKFNIDIPYQETVVGKGIYNENGLVLLPNFVGKKEDLARSWALQHHVKININYITSTNPNYVVGQITNQNAITGMDPKYIGPNGMTLTVIDKIELPIVVPTILDCNSVDNKLDSYCQVPNFLDDTPVIVQAWFTKRDLKINLIIKEIPTTDPAYNLLKAGLVTSQSEMQGVSLYSLINKNFTIEYMAN